MYQIKAGERETYQKSVSLPPKPGELASLRLIQFLSKIFLHKNIQLELTKHCWALTSTSRYGNDNTKCCYKQYIRRQNTKTEQNFNPGLAIICLSGIGHCTTAALNLLHYPCTILGDPQRQSVGSGLVPPFLGFLSLSIRRFWGKGENGSEKGREVKERKFPLPQPRRKAWYSG